MSQVWRNGHLVRIVQSEVVVGDIVDLSAGDAVPADGIYVFGDDPATNEAKMTGESKDIEKNPRHPFLLGGTEVSSLLTVHAIDHLAPVFCYSAVEAWRPHVLGHLRWCQLLLRSHHECLGHRGRGYSSAAQAGGPGGVHQVSIECAVA